MKRLAVAMNRREFLKKAGVGSMAFASLPTLAPILARPALDDDDGRTNFFFLSFSQGGVVDGVNHRIAMAGAGKISEAGVKGGGSFTHLNAASSVPQTVLASGAWKAKSLVSFTLAGLWGSQFVAGILEMTVSLVADFPSRVVLPATLRVVCNLGPAGISTGEPEGFKLTVPGAPFSPFVPTTFPGTSFPFGLTLFTKGVGEGDDD